MYGHPPRDSTSARGDGNWVLDDGAVSKNQPCSTARLPLGSVRTLDRKFAIPLGGPGQKARSSFRDRRKRMMPRPTAAIDNSSGPDGSSITSSGDGSTQCDLR